MINTPTAGAWGTGLQSLGLALLVGGILVLGALVAPMLFKSFPRADAGVAMLTIFRRYDMVLLGALALIAVGEALRVMAFGWPSLSFFGVGRYVVMGVLMLLVLASGFYLNPKMAKIAQSEGFQTNLEQREAFQSSHKVSEKFAKMELLLGVMLLLLTPFVGASSKLP